MAGAAYNLHSCISTSATAMELGVCQVLLVLSFIALASGTNVRPTTINIPALIILGDSTVDAGNNNGLETVVKSDFPPYGRIFPGGPTGRFCDGRLAVDYIAEGLGLPHPLPYLSPAARGAPLLKGVNFASAASGWYDRTARIANVIPFPAQVGWFREYKQKLQTLVGPQQSRYIISNALYLISTGSNDYVNNYYINPVLQRQFSLQQYQPFLVGIARSFLQELYNEGARNIAIGGLPPLGCLPSQITLHGDGINCIASFNAVAASYNAALNQMTQNLKPSLPGSRLMYMDSLQYPLHVLQNPLAYGFRDTRQACCGTGFIEAAILCNADSYGTCPDASSFFFFDSFHPTDAFNKAFSQVYLNSLLPKLRAPPQS